MKKKEILSKYYSTAYNQLKMDKEYIKSPAESVSLEVALDQFKKALSEFLKYPGADKKMKQIFDDFFKK
jgi:ABC-type amino acid transport substrate-binding protein